MSKIYNKKSNYELWFRHQLLKQKIQEENFRQFFIESPLQWWIIVRIRCIIIVISNVEADSTTEQLISIIIIGLFTLRTHDGGRVFPSYSTYGLSQKSHNTNIISYITFRMQLALEHSFKFKVNTESKRVFHIYCDKINKSDENMKAVLRLLA